ncbi:MAG: hypothetical protein IJE68_04300 [Clostridia bacterium]|nr:hypothetical protein [Clostridia bacterium]
MKRFICRQNPRYHQLAAIRIITEVLTHIPNDKIVFVLMDQDIKALMRSGPGVYYVATQRPLGLKVIHSDVRHYFYLFRVINKKNRIQTFLIPRIPNAIW